MSNGYETAPATEMLATHCCACGRALVDAVSVESGMGPDCREKYGRWPADVDRVAVNKLVNGIAVRQNATAAELAALHKLGANVIAARIAQRFARVMIEEEDNVLLVWTPRYDEGVVAAMRRVPRQWDAEHKCYRVSEAFKASLWTALKTLPGYGYGPKGAFTLSPA